MNWRIARQFVFVLSLLTFLLSHGTVGAQKLPSTKAKKPAAAATAEPALPQSAEQVDAYMGSLTDEQARKALSRTLKQQLAGKGQAGEVERGMDAGLGKHFTRLAGGVAALKEKLAATVATADADQDTLAAAWERVTAGGGLPRFALALLWLAGFLTAGFAARAAFFRTARDLTACMATAAALGRLELIGRVISNALVQALGLLVFAAVSFALFVVFFDKGEPGYELVSVYLLLGYYVLILAVAARILFAPGAPALRLFPMPDDVAHRVHRWLMAVILGAAVVTGASLVLDEAGVGRSTFLLAYSLSGVYFVLALLAADLVPPQAGGRCAAACRRGCGRRRGARRAGARVALAGIRVRGRHGGVLGIRRADRRRRPGGPTHLEPVRHPGRDRDRPLGAAAH